MGWIGRAKLLQMCWVMSPVATAELGTDGWIKGLMKQVLEGRNINPAYALVFAATIMLVLRVFAGGILKLFSPPGLLCISGVFSAIGLYWLSGAAGTAVFVAFVLYALGQTYYWPCVLGFVSERYPQGGALTLNTVSAIGLLSAGSVGTPILGAALDKSIHASVSEHAPALAEAASEDGSFMWMKHKKIDPDLRAAFTEQLSPDEAEHVNAVFTASKAEAGRDVLMYAVRFPVILLLAFGAIAFWFRSRGGYKPIVLQRE
mgnify:CR=1 FL=1